MMIKHHTNKQEGKKDFFLAYRDDINSFQDYFTCNCHTQSLVHGEELQPNVLLYM